MKKLFITGILAAAAVSNASWAAQPTTGHGISMLPLLLSHAGHDHAATGHAGGHGADLSKAKVSEHLTVSACWIRLVPTPAPSAGYFVVKNASSKEAKLQSASSSAYGMVMLHQTTHSDGMSRMSETHDIAIPAGGELEFKPGGYHAMLEKPAAPAPKVGDKVAMDFLFDTGEKATAQCEVKPATAKGH